MSQQQQPAGLRPSGRIVAVVVVAALTLVAVVVLVGWWWSGRAQPVPWKTVEVRDLDVVVEYEGRACEEFAHLDIRTDEEEVVLTVEAGGRGVGCDDEGRIRTVTGRLEEPLGARQVVDGACRTARLANDLACEGK